MAEDMVTVPADAVHAVLGVFARISHLAGSDAIRVLREALPEQDRTRAQLFALQAHLPAVLDALRFTVVNTDTKARARRYEAALEALGGGEEQP